MTFFCCDLPLALGDDELDHLPLTVCPGSFEDSFCVVVEQGGDKTSVVNQKVVKS